MPAAKVNRRGRTALWGRFKNTNTQSEFRGDREDSDYVFYWMISSRRLRSNFALDRALEQCAVFGSIRYTSSQGFREELYSEEIAGFLDRRAKLAETFVSGSQIPSPAMEKLMPPRESEKVGGEQVLWVADLRRLGGVTQDNAWLGA